MNNYYNEQKENGDEFLDYVSDKLTEHGLIIQNYCSRKYQYNVGENKQGIEIKFDMMYEKTGNLWIECQEKTKVGNKDWVNSGIFRDDNSWLYLIGNYNIIYIFTIKVLRYLADKYEIRENNMGTSRGFLLLKGNAEIFACKIIL